MAERTLSGGFFLALCGGGVWIKPFCGGVFHLWCLEVLVMMFLNSKA